MVTKRYVIVFILKSHNPSRVQLWNREKSLKDFENSLPDFRVEVVEYQMRICLCWRKQREGRGNVHATSEAKKVTG
jgi:hypothetical protein